MEETFKGETAILDKLKVVATKAQQKYSNYHDELTAIERRLNGFGYTINFENAEITQTKK